MVMDQQMVSQKDLEIETALLKAMSNRFNFETYNDSINTKRIYEATGVVLKDYEKYFNLYKEHKEVDFKLFYTQFSQSWHNDDLDNEDITYYRDYVLPAIDKANAQEVETSLLGLMQKQTLEEINKSAKKTFDIEEISSILEEYRAKQGQIIQENDNDCFTIDNIDFDVLDKQSGIPYFMPNLQASLGSLVKGQFIVVSADTGAGKSAFSISQGVEAFKFLHKTKSDRPILYFNSEGTEADVYIRFLSNLYKDKIAGGFEQVLNNIDKVKESYMSKFNHNNFKVFQLSGNNIAYVKSKMQQYNPSLVIIDIVDSLAPEESPGLLKKLYDTIRQMSNTFCPIIGTTQSGDMSYFDKDSGQKMYRKWLDAKDMYGSKQKAGAADTVVGIGQDPESDLRYISVPKKKRGDPVKITCELEGIYSNFKEVQW